MGQPAPKFSLTGHDGKTYKLEEFKNKKMVVLEWFNNECPFVKKHYDSGHMQHLQEKYVSKDLAWFSIS
ncbi:redoxin family protein, partial [Vibrio parahaemolyticus]